MTFRVTVCRPRLRAIAICMSSFIGSGSDTAILDIEVLDVMASSPPFFKASFSFTVAKVVASGGSLAFRGPGLANTVPNP